jgi:hypothetical protein
LPDDDELFAQLSEGLRLAQLRLRTLPGDDDVKGSIAQRLIAITNSAKHDLHTAAERLAALNAELDARDEAAG